jgi:ribosomal protein L37AE/L43A
MKRIANNQTALLKGRESPHPTKIWECEACANEEYQGKTCYRPVTLLQFQFIHPN